MIRIYVFNLILPSIHRQLLFIFQKFNTMKKLILLFLLSIGSKFSIGQTTYHPKSTITSATIYESGAMITRNIDTKLIRSNGLILIDSLPQHINPKSIQAKCGNGLKIVSIKNTSTIERIHKNAKKDSIGLLITAYTDSIDYQNTLLKSIKKEIEVIHKNDNFSTEDGTNMNQLAKASDLYKTNLRALNLEQLAISKKRDRQIEKRNNLKGIFDNIRVESFKNIGVEIKVEFVSNIDNTLTLSYFTPNASWYTFYDLRVSGEVNSSFLNHKAYVSQSTGEDWVDVKLTLSNRNPNKRINPPSISPYILQNIKHHAYSQPTIKENERKPQPGSICGVVRDKSGDALIGANVIIKGTNIGTVTDIDGAFCLPTVDNQVLAVSYTGFQTQEINVSGLSYTGIILTESYMLDEIVVTGYAGDDFRKKSKRFKAEKIEVRKSIAVKPQESLNVHSFEIMDPYSIPSNGEEYDVLLITNSIPFAYQYVTYPSEEPTAYLSVGIPDWRAYDLFSGNVNLFLEGQYTGVSNLNIQAKTDTLWFSLGEDIGVNVEKERVEEFNKKSFFKNKTIELHTFDIVVTNNKNKTIKLDIMDQVPISTDDDINVKVLEISDAEYEEKSGFLTWKETFLAGERKTFRVSYEIKYGKNVDIVGN